MAMAVRYAFHANDKDFRKFMASGRRRKPADQPDTKTARAELIALMGAKVGKK